LICSLAAFSFVFLEWKGREIISVDYAGHAHHPVRDDRDPASADGLAAALDRVRGFEIGWLNTYRVQIIPWIADGLTIFLFVQFFKDLPRELIEASRVEGASWWQIYRKVVMPLSGPVLATAAILKFLFMYNQYLWPLIVVQEEAIRPVMVGLGYFFQLNVRGARSWPTSPSSRRRCSLSILCCNAPSSPRSHRPASKVTDLGHRLEPSRRMDLGQLVCP
jgi:multiple sugar transport system permease protein